MKCQYCKQVCKDNFVKKGNFVAHIPCLAKARDKQRQVKAVNTSFKECSECHRNCHNNHVTYKGYWFHKQCLFERIKRVMGADTAVSVIQSVQVTCQ